MKRAEHGSIAAYCRSEGYQYYAELLNLQLSGVIFRAGTEIRVRDVIGGDSFILARVQPRGLFGRQVAVLMLPLPRPVPNMILVSRPGSVLPRLGIAFRPDQRLTLDDDLGSRFELFVPQEYEPDAKEIVTPDLIAQLDDSVGISDVEFVDDRVLLYAPVDVFYAPARLTRAAQLAASLGETLYRRSASYLDPDGIDDAWRDPFRQAQLTSFGSIGFAVGHQARRLKTRRTVRQRIVLGIAIAVALLAAIYWVGMIVAAFVLH